jgi:hypothetical protein
MQACTRCGRRHTDAEETMSKKLSCTEVKQFWIGIRREHEKFYGHMAQITTDSVGNWICQTCNRRL